MAGPTLTQRVEILEQKVERLETLPARMAAVEWQIVQLRDEMQGGFSAVRQEMAVMADDLRTELHRGLHGIRGELDGIHGELDGLHGEFDGLRAEIRAGDEETRRYMRVLYEDLIARIAALGDVRR